MPTQKSFHFERKLSSSPSGVWNTLAALGGVDEWLPMITSCRVDGAGAGAHRYCETADGGKLEERITEVDHEQRRLGYEITAGLPVTKYSGVFTVEGDRLLWDVEAEGDAEGIAQIDAMLEQVVPMAFDGLEATASKMTA